MDPFESDDGAEQPSNTDHVSLASPTPPTLPPHRRALATHISSGEVADPFGMEGEDDADIGDDEYGEQYEASTSMHSPSSIFVGGSSDGVGRGSPQSPGLAATPAIPSIPKRVSHTSASQLLSTTDPFAGPSKYGSKPPPPPHNAHDHGQEAVRLASMANPQASTRASPDLPPEEEEEEESARLVHRATADDQRTRPPSSRSSASNTSSTVSPRWQRRGRSALVGNESLATLKAIGRRIMRSARQIQDEDASTHRNREGGSTGAGTNGPIHLEFGPGEGNRPATLKGTAWTRLNERDRALWLWANVEDLDEFLRELYSYYTGKGLVCIILTRSLNLLTIAFVIGFTTFLFGCVDYSSIRHDGQLREVVVQGCISRFSSLTVLALVAFAIVYVLQVVRFGLSLSRLSAMHHFYQHLLDIPEEDIQTIPWHQVISRLSSLLSTHPIASRSTRSGSSTQEIDVHEAANRLMRHDNYMIAILNRDLLDLRLPLPAFLGRTEGSSPVLTRSLLWNLNFCLLGFLIDQDGNVRRQFLSERHRTELIAGLKRRLIFMAAINAIFAPFIIMYLIVYSFFRYFEEYHKNPASLGSRQYTELARWKFREFNELPHLFRKRCHASYPYAQRYIEQFPKERSAILARFVSFVAGSFAAVLVLAAVLDPDLFLHFEITPQRNTLFYIGIFGAILAVARGMIPDERLVFEPEVLLEGVIYYTHYRPEEWRGQFHSAKVNADFSRLYSLKITIFIVEVLSVLLTPLVLCFSLPSNASAVIDFFRESTVHVEGLGYVCSFAVFDFARHGKTKTSSDEQDFSTEEGHAAANGGGGHSKMEQSALHFAAANDWQPDPASSLYLSRLQTQYWQASQRGAAGNAAQLSQHSQPSNAQAILAGFGSSTELAQRSRLYEDAFERSMRRTDRDAGVNRRDAVTGPKSAGKARGIVMDKSALNSNPQAAASRSHGVLQAVCEGDDGDESVLSSLGDFADPMAEVRDEQVSRQWDGDRADGALPRSLRQHLHAIL